MKLYAYMYISVNLLLDVMSLLLTFIHCSLIIVSFYYVRHLLFEKQHYYSLSNIDKNCKLM